MLEALYNGSCRKQAEIKQISTTNGLIGMTGIAVPSQRFNNSNISKNPEKLSL
jgi:hypothetical protein